MGGAFHGEKLFYNVFFLPIFIYCLTLITVIATNSHFLGRSEINLFDMLSNYNKHNMSISVDQLSEFGG